MTSCPSWPEGAREIRPSRLWPTSGSTQSYAGKTSWVYASLRATGRLPEIRQVVMASGNGSFRKLRSPRNFTPADSFCEHFGAGPAFVDGHQHVQILRRSVTSFSRASNKGGFPARSGCGRAPIALRESCGAASKWQSAWHCLAARGFATRRLRAASSPTKGSLAFRHSIWDVITAPILPVISARQDAVILSCVIPVIATKSSWRRPGHS